MELRQLEHFLAVVRHGSFTAAAREVHIVQSALSTSVRKLEASLGAPLFERTTRRVLLTEAGRALVPMAHRITAEVDAARGEVAAVAGLTSGAVAIGTIQTLTEVDLPRRLGEFRRSHPGVRLHVREGVMPELTRAVLDGELDLAFLATTGALPGELAGFAQWTQRMVLVCHPGHRLAHRRRVRLAECDGEPLVSFTGSDLEKLVDRGFVEAGVRYHRLCEATHIPLLIELVAAGLGVGVVPEPIAERCGLPYARITEPALSRTIHLAGRLHEQVNPAARSLLQQLTDPD